MTLMEALNECKNGSLVSHEEFDSNEYMYFSNGSFYYEDGTNLDNHLEWLMTQEWAKQGWHVKNCA